MKNKFKKMTTEEIQSVNLEILKHIDKFCREHNIRYWLDAGTLIGAIRHKGFIPWDDDADICMPRPDYERFLKEYKDSSKYKLYAPEKENCYLVYARLCEMEETYFDFGAKWTKDSPGVGVDIFPVNGAPDTIEEFDKVIEQCEKNRLRIFRCRQAFMPPRFRHTLVGFLKDVVHFGVKIMYRTFGAIYAKRILRDQVALFRKYAYEEHPYCYDLTVSISRKKYWPKAWFDGLIEVDFCGVRLFAPIGYDERLRRGYGDYMQLPPESERIVHGKWQTMYWRDK